MDHANKYNSDGVTANILFNRSQSQSAEMFESTAYGLSFIFETRIFATGDFILNGVPFEVLLSNIL